MMRRLGSFTLSIKATTTTFGSPQLQLLGKGRSSTTTTHEVFNQSPPLEGFNPFLSNTRLQESLTAFNTLFVSTDTEDLRRQLVAYGKHCGSEYWNEQAHLANTHTPTFTPFDRQGRRTNSVAFHDSYHRLMKLARTNEVPSYSHQRGGNGCGGNQVARSSLNYLHYSLEQGTACPMTMTFAAVPVLQESNKAGVFDEWIQKMISPVYDPRDVPITEKKGITCGMSMTEKQGGSDVRANTTFAVPAQHCRQSGSSLPPAGVAGSPYSLSGHKWFTSAPMCDAFLVLAYVKGGGDGDDGSSVKKASAAGPSCFLVPRWLGSEQRNEGLRFQQLKNKAGDKSNASSEVEYDGATGYLVGEVGRGVKTIIEMVNNTRLDCLVGSAALMQQSLFHAIHHARHRQAFGAKLIDQPLMQNVLCDIALECEGATALAMRVAHAFDNSSNTAENPKIAAQEEAFKRIVVAIGKYFVCKRAPSVVYECLECLGGNGFVEGFPLARYFRQSPLNAVWEGSGNVIVLDVFRALSKEKAAMAAIAAEVEKHGSEDVKNVFGELARDMTVGLSPTEAQLRGRELVERLALVLQACALNAVGCPAVYNAFVQSRVLHRHDTMLGTLPAKLVTTELLDRHTPVF